MIDSSIIMIGTMTNKRNLVGYMHIFKDMCNDFEDLSSLIDEYYNLGQLSLKDSFKMIDLNAFISNVTDIITVDCL